ncbi:uncharacterized protein LOC143891303 [Tasmannia lanceolata]|uniref:uncharacterized protein LOC143891303 n=1 Tax=Tasmannia lanceolata TaxID=3420 RepID=UPI004062E42D
MDMGNHGPSGIGGLLRNEGGEVIWAFRGPIGVADANEAEVKAMYHGIKLLQNVDLNKIEVEGDSLNVIRWLRGSKAIPWRFASLFDEIRERIGVASVSFCHVRRSANAEADRLAREGVSKESFELFDFLPP